MKISTSLKILFNQLYIYIFSISLIPTVSFISCSQPAPDHRKFIDAYIDLRVTEDTLRTENNSLENVKKKILKRHGITEEQYEETFNHFNENPELWNEFYDEIIARVDTLRKTGK